MVVYPLIVRFGKQSGLVSLAAGAMLLVGSYFQREESVLCPILIGIGCLVLVLGVLSLLVRAPLLRIDAEAVRVYGGLGIFHRTFALAPGDRLIAREGRLWIERASGESKRLPVAANQACRKDWEAMQQAIGSGV